MGTRNTGAQRRLVSVYTADRSEVRNLHCANFLKEVLSDTWDQPLIEARRCAGQG